MNSSQFYEWAEDTLKLKLSSYREEQLTRRIESFMVKYNLPSYMEFIEALLNSKDLTNKFKGYITINVTEFFRNPNHFDKLKETLEEEFENRKKIKVWSAACSKGCEPYSLAMLLEELELEGDYEILATDIDEAILENAKEGCYSLEEIKNIKKSFRDKYLEIKDDKYFIGKKIKSKIVFKKQDLLLDKYKNDFDLIVCRNVVIYFKEEAKNMVIENLSRSLKVGGLLFLGGTEGIYNYKEYGLIKLSTYIYKRI